MSFFRLFIPLGTMVEMVEDTLRTLVAIKKFAAPR